MNETITIRRKKRILARVLVLEGVFETGKIRLVES